MMNTNFLLQRGQDLTQPATEDQSVGVDKEQALLENELTRVIKKIKGGLSPIQYAQAEALKFGLEASLLITKKTFTQSKEK